VGGQLTGGVGADVLQVAPLAEVAIPIAPAQRPDGDADGVLREGRQAADVRLAGAALEGAELELRHTDTNSGAVLSWRSSPQPQRLAGSLLQQQL